MADNKKKKVNWRDDLASQAAKMKESVIVYINGEPETLVRGDQTDEQWDSIKKRAAADAAKQPERWSGDMVVAKSGSGQVKIVRDNQTDAEWAKVVEDTQRTYGKDNVEHRYTEPDERGKGDQWGPGTIFPTREDYNRLQSMPSGPEKKAELDRLKKQYDEEQSSSEMWRNASEAQKSTKDAKKRVQEQKAATDKQEWNEEQASADPGMSVRGQMMRLATGATPGAKLKSGVVDNYSGAADEAGQIANAVGNEASKVGNELAAAPAKVGEGLAKAGSELAAVPGKVAESPVGDFMQNAGQTVTDIGKGMMGVAPATSVQGLAQSVANSPKLKALMSPNMSPREIWNEEQKAKMDPGVEYDPATMPAEQHPNPTQPPQAPPPPAEADPMSVAMSMAAKMPTGFRVEQADPKIKAEYEASRARTQAEVENAKDKIAALDVVQEGMLREAGKRERAAMEEANLNAKLAAEAKQIATNEMQRFETARMKVVEQARQAASDPLDPNRFWNNKSDGQKAAAILAGALFGFTGQGMNWLQRIDGLIENDMRAQAADRTSRVQGLQAEAAGLGEAGQRAMQAGASRAEAFLIEKQAKIEGLKSYMEMMSMKLNNVQAQQAAAEKIAMLEMKSTQVAQQAAELAQLEAHQKTDANFKNAQLRQESIKTSMSLAAKAASDKAEHVRGPQAMELGGLAAAEQVARDLKSKFGDKNIVSRFLDKGLAMFPGTDAKAYNIARDQAINMIAPLMGAGVLQKHDLDRWEGLMAKAGDLNGEEILNILVQDIQNTYNSKRAALQQAGMDMSRFPTLGGSVPGTAPGNKSGVDFTPVRPTGF